MRAPLQLLLLLPLSFPPRLPDPNRSSSLVGEEEAEPDVGKRSCAKVAKLAALMQSRELNSGASGSGQDECAGRVCNNCPFK